MQEKILFESTYYTKIENIVPFYRKLTLVRTDEK